MFLNIVRKDRVMTDLSARAIIVNSFLDLKSFSQNWLINFF